MPRAPRHFVAGATYHVICRGNHQQPIFQSDPDYRYFCNLLSNSINRFDHTVIAYCLMTNHVHLAVQIGEVSLSTILHAILFRYAQVFNVKYETSGHLFQGRFQAELVDTPQYFQTLIRYIHLNPVKAGIVDTPHEYPWSSYRAYLGTETTPWLSPKIELGPRAPDSEILRLDRFEQLRPHRKNERLDELLLAISERLGVAPETLKCAARDYPTVQARAVAAVVAKKVRGITLTELATHFGQTPAALSKAASRIEAKLRTSADLRAVVAELSQQLTST